MRSTKRVCFIVAAAVSLLLLGPFLSHAQPPSNAPSSREDLRRVYPRVKLMYYTGREGDIREEIHYFDLTEWTADKDVIITGGWAETDGTVSPGARAPSERQYNNLSAGPRARSQRHRTWKVEYVDALNDGKSHLFVGGDGLRRTAQSIYAEDDFIALLNVPNSGWHVLGQAARLYRYRGLTGSYSTPSDSRNSQ